MHLRLYRTTLAAAERLLNEFDVPCLVKFYNRGLRSRAGGSSANPRIKISDNERGQPQSMLPSTFEEDYPPLSVNKGKSKRRTRIDLGTGSKEKSEVAQNIGPLQCEASNMGSCSTQKLVVKNIGPLQREASDLITSTKQNLDDVHTNAPLQCEASTSISDYYDTDLPTSFGKKQSKASKLHQTYRKPREAKGRSRPSSRTSIDEPFDICPRETTESTRNEGMRSPKRQLAEKNEQNKSVGEKECITEYSVEESGVVLRPGMILLKNYIPLSEQVKIVNKCRELGLGPGGFYRPGYNDGAKLRLYMMCLGLDWNPQTMSYGKRRHHDDAAPPDLPNEFASLVCRALDDSHNLIETYPKVENVEDELPKMSPDVCIVNFYTTTGRLGLHQDRDESKESLRRGLPVVSISIGDSAEFLYGDERDVNKAKSVSLESGDVLIFGGKSRHTYHGVKSIEPGTAPPALLETTRLQPGRLNLTFRQNQVSQSRIP